MYKCSVSFSYYHYVKRKKRGKKEKCRLQFFFKVYLFTYFWLHWVFVSALQLSLAMVSRATVHCGVRASHGGGFSCYKARAPGVWAP